MRPRHGTWETRLRSRPVRPYLLLPPPQATHSEHPRLPIPGSTVSKTPGVAPKVPTRPSDFISYRPTWLQLPSQAPSPHLPPSASCICAPEPSQKQAQRGGSHCVQPPADVSPHPRRATTPPWELHSARLNSCLPNATNNHWNPEPAARGGSRPPPQRFRAVLRQPPGLTYGEDKASCFRYHEAYDARELRAPRDGITRAARNLGHPANNANYACSSSSPGTAQDLHRTCVPSVISQGLPTPNTTQTSGTQVSRCRVQDTVTRNVRMCGAAMRFSPSLCDLKTPWKREAGAWSLHPSRH